MRYNLLFVVFVLAVVGLLYATSGHRTPRVPLDDSHRTLEDKALCLSCHGPGMESARKSSHPPKDDCMLCHRVKKNDPRLKRNAGL